tara:strand:- start:821 stop:2620 length:1800 start_codon:yes stop_codon:yes gene_type:complete
MEDSYKNLSIASLNTLNNSISIVDKKVNFSEDFKLEDYTKSKTGSKNFDKIIKEYCIANKKNVDLLLLLRCKISHSIHLPINRLFAQYQKRGIYLNKNDMLQIVLEDDGERYLRTKKLEYNDLNEIEFNEENFRSIIKKNNDNKNYYFSNLKRRKFNYELIENLIKNVQIYQFKERIRFNLERNISSLIILSKLFRIFRLKFFKFSNSKINIFKEKFQRISPLSAEIIYSFNQFGNAEIATWTKWCVYGDKYLKDYCFTKSGRKEVLLSNFGLLGNVPSSVIEKAWSNKYGKNKLKIDYLNKFLQNYKKYYPKFSKSLRDNKYNIKKHKEFIMHLDKDQKDLDKVYAYIEEVAEAVLFNSFPGILDTSRKEINQNDGKKLFSEDLIELIPTPNKEELSELEMFVNQLIDKEAYKHLRKRLIDDQEKWEKTPERKLAWVLFSEIDSRPYNLDDFRYILSECNKLVLHRNKYIKNENLKEKEHNPGWLSKIYKFNKIAGNTFNDTYIKLKNACEDKDYLDQINPGNNKGNKYLYENLRKIFMINKLNDSNEIIKTFIFEDKKIFKKFQINFQNILNPKKGRKYRLSYIVRKLLDDENIKYD